VLGTYAALLAHGLLDELSTGVPVSAAGLFQTRLQISASLLTLGLFTIPVGVAIAIEPPLFLWAGKRSRTRVISISLLLVALGAVLLAFTGSFMGLLLSLTLWYPAIGLAAGLAQAELMDREPAQRERNLTRWTLLSAIGDVAAPALLAASVKLHASYRGALLVAALVCILLALRLWFIAPVSPSEEEEDVPKTKSLRAILQNRALLIWLLGASLCDMMDETLTALAAVRVERELHGDPWALLLVLSAIPLGGTLSLLAVERLLLRMRATLLLGASCVLTVLALALFLVSRSVEAMALSALLLGAADAAHYPIAQAQAYRAAPEDSDWVASLGSAFTILTVISTPVLGLVVDHHGLSWGFLTLCLQPAGLLLILGATRADRRSARGAAD
jgi:predicted MFS family arabinose efflux permease